jgi:hypothetical protein
MHKWGIFELTITTCETVSRKSAICLDFERTNSAALLLRGCKTFSNIHPPTLNALAINFSLSPAVVAP